MKTHKFSWNQIRKMGREHLSYHLAIIYVGVIAIECWNQYGYSEQDITILNGIIYKSDLTTNQLKSDLNTIMKG